MIITNESVSSEFCMGEGFEGKGCCILKKNWTWLAVLAAAGTVIGLVIAYFCKKKDGEYMEDQADEEEDFELDSDLKPVSEREYVPLNKAADIAARRAEMESEEDEARDTVSEETEKPAAEELKDQEEAAEEDASGKVQI